MDYDFSKLTPLQEWLICYQGWRVGQTYPSGAPWPQPSNRTVKKLIERGLMTSRKVIDRSGWIAVEVTEYDVAPAVHVAWCFSCKAKD